MCYSQAVSVQKNICITSHPTITWSEQCYFPCNVWSYSQILQNRSFTFCRLKISEPDFHQKETSIKTEVSTSFFIYFTANISWLLFTQDSKRLNVHVAGSSIQVYAFRNFSQVGNCRISRALNKVGNWGISRTKDFQNFRISRDLDNLNLTREWPDHKT